MYINSRQTLFFRNTFGRKKPSGSAECAELGKALFDKAPQRETPGEPGVTVLPPGASPIVPPRQVPAEDVSSEWPLWDRINPDVRKEVECCLIQNPEDLQLGEEIGHGKLTTTGHKG